MAPKQIWAMLFGPNAKYEAGGPESNSNPSFATPRPTCGVSKATPPSAASTADSLVFALPVASTAHGEETTV